MKFTRHEIILSSIGVVSSLAIAYLIYRLEQTHASEAEANAQANSDQIQSELANQQAQIASLPSINVPSISSTPSQLPASEPTQSNTVDAINKIVTAFQAEDNSHITSAITPIAALSSSQIDAVLNSVSPTSTAPVSPSYRPVAHPIYSVSN